MNASGLDTWEFKSKCIQILPQLQSLPGGGQIKSIPHTPLHPIPAIGEQFEWVIVDCVRPLPKTKTGNHYLLTIMCATTHFPEASSLRKITASSVGRALKFFTTFGLARVIQTNQGPNFQSKLFKQVLQTLCFRVHIIQSLKVCQSAGIRR